jgi:hypothetical protein
MGKKTRPFINKKLAQSFHLTHTANHDDYSEDDQENTDHSDDITIDARGHEPGEAAKFGIFFGDQNEYDYLQHMREVGRSINAVLIEAKASTSSSMAKKPEKPTGLITLVKILII